MNATEVIERIRANEQELRDKDGKLTLTLFGSVARGEARPHDVDLTVEFDRSKRVTLLTMSALQRRLSGMVGARVDLSEKAALHQLVRENAERDFACVLWQTWAEVLSGHPECH